MNKHYLHLVPFPFLGLACAPIFETRFLELAVSLLDFSPWISLGAFSIFLDNTNALNLQITKSYQKQNRESTDRYSRWKVKKSWQNWSQQLMHMQIPKRTKQSVRKGKCTLLACHSLQMYMQIPKRTKQSVRKGKCTLLACHSLQLKQLAFR